jgi:hypothetical protein
MTKQSEDVIAWRTMDTAARERAIDRLRPAVRDVATGLGARNDGERRDVLEALGLTCLVEAGWIVLGPPRDDETRRRYL